MRYNSLNGTQESILLFLFKSDNPPTIRSLARELEKPYPLIHKNIIKLETNNIIERKNVPPAQLISIKDSLPKDILIYLENLKKLKFIEKNKWIKVMLEDLFSYIDNKFFILLVFGSYAKDKQTKNSDLDLLIITSQKEDFGEMEIAIKKIYTKVKKNFVIVDIGDFKEMVKNQKEFNVGNEAVKNHILLYGAEQYYEIIK